MTTQLSIFHNTISLTGNELKEVLEQCKRQEDRIYKLMKGNSSKTAFEIWDLYNSILPEVPITSIRRALTNMSKEVPPRFIKSGKAQMKKERLGKNNHRYFAI